MEAGKKIGFWGVVATVYFNSCGGPFGSEPALSAAGPLYTMLTFTVLPLLWSAPMIAMTNELTCAMPENGGFTLWVQRAFGDKTGVVVGVLQWSSGVVDSAIYPVIVWSSIRAYLDLGQLTWQINSLVHMVMTVLLIMPFAFGVRGVSSLLMVTMYLLVLAFGLLVGMGISSLNLEAITAAPQGPVKWGDLASVGMWCLGTWDAISTMAGEIQSIPDVLPQAMWTALLLVSLSYLLPLAVSISTMPLDYGWSEGGGLQGLFVMTGMKLGGNALGIGMMGASVVANCSQFLAEFTADTYLLMGLEHTPYLHILTRKVGRNQVPVYGVAFNACIQCVMVTLPFLDIIQIGNIFFGVSNLIEFAALIKLRVSAPEMERPWRVPGGLVGVIAMSCPPAALIVFNIGTANPILRFWTATFITLILVVAHIRSPDRRPNVAGVSGDAQDETSPTRKQTNDEATALLQGNMPK